MKILFLIALSLTLFISTNNVDAQVCSYKNTATNVSINLAELWSPNSQLTIKAKSGNTYYVAICGKAPICDKTVVKPAAVCQLNSAGAYLNFGQPATYNITSNPNDKYGATLNYQSASKCNPTTNTYRSSVLNFQCSGDTPTIVGVNEITANGKMCLVTFTINIPCPDVTIPSSDEPEPKKSIGGGWVFIIILICGFSLYAAVGSVVNWKVRHLHGKEIFPNYHGWANGVSLVKDGVYFIRGKISGTPYHGASYQQI
ncbi:hypothetical protein DLAC_02213 [Tieghemostelium lacteum]|uniref:Autophagy-related protein 27 n=1 Tax=Tieghemostelium lacteum TaxID=361077 RepID=A0A152A4V7_TIELA|nr:hypothetical protein DLAC_02213 [Tieghemostelium lacteum]|eukprot:KYR01111.1 hypothetical protein DLAC_02213 [Tieghemostelium lacteum]